MKHCSGCLTVNDLKFRTPNCLTNDYANSADPDQTAPGRSSLIRVYTVCLSTSYFKKQLHKKQNLGQNNME